VPAVPAGAGDVVIYVLSPLNVMALWALAAKK